MNRNGKLLFVMHEVSALLRVAAGALSLLLCLLQTGCANDGWQRLLYDVGDQYACQQSHVKQRDERARGAQCADTGHPDRTRYDDYQAAREQRQ